MVLLSISRGLKIVLNFLKDDLFGKRNVTQDEPDRLRTRSEDEVQYNLRNSTIVFINGTVTGGSVVTMYTVPAGKKLFMTQLTLAATNSSTSPRSASVDKGGTGFAQVRCGGVVAGTSETNANIALPLILPIQADAGVAVTITGSAAGITAQARVVGWLEDA